MAQSHESLLAAKRRYREANRERLNAIQAEYYRTHAEERKAYARQYLQDHKEAARLKCKAWKSRNPEYMKKYLHDYYQRNKAKFNAYALNAYYAGKRTEINARVRKKAVDNLTDWYVRDLLKMPDAPKGLIEVKRIQMKIRRLLRNEQAKH